MEYQVTLVKLKLVVYVREGGRWRWCCREGEEDLAGGRMYCTSVGPTARDDSPNVSLIH